MLDIRKLVIASIDERVRRFMRGVRTSIKSLLDPAWTSGNPKTKRGGESAAANITEQIVAAYALKAMAASDTIKESQVASGHVIDGALANVGDAGLITADKVVQVGTLYVTPGNTTTLQTANTERNVPGDTFTDVKEFRLGLPGRYRIALELARSGAAAPEVKLEVEMPDGLRVAASATISTPSAVHPTFGASTNLDMTTTAPMNANLFVMLRSTSAAQTGYVRNVALKFDVATTAPAIHSAVITD